MLLRARRAALLRAAFAAAAITPAVAAPAHAAWPNGTEAIVQAAEGSPQLPSVVSGGPPVQKLLAQGYGFIPGPAVGGTITGPALKIRYFESNTTGNGRRAISLLDFDRNGKPEYLVDTTVPIGNQSGTESNGTYSVFAISGADADRCVTVPAPSARLFGGDTEGYNPNEGLLISTIPLQGLASRMSSPGLLRLAPRVLTVIARTSPAAGGGVVGPIDATFPAAAARSTGCTTGQLSYDFSKALDRYPAGSTPTGKVTHTDATGDKNGGTADLTDVTVERYTTPLSDRPDATDQNNSSPARTVYPADLTIGFKAGEGASSLTYVWPSTWARGQSRLTPSALIRTEADGANATVTMWRSLTTTNLDGSDTPRCLTRGDETDASRLTFKLPLTTANGISRVSVPLDSITGSEQGPYTGNGFANFRFHTISDPGITGTGAAIDHVPFFAAFSQGGTNGATGCLNGSTPGAQVYTDRSFTVADTQPRVELTASTETPARGANVTFGLGATDAGTRRCLFLPDAAANDCSAGFLTRTYTQPASAYLSLDAADGRWDSDQVDIRPQNNRPTVEIARVDAAAEPRPGTDDTYAIVRGAAVALPLKAVPTDSDGTISAYEWTRGTSPTVVSTAATYTPSFATAGTYTVNLRVKDDSGDAATQWSDTKTFTVKVARSPEGEIGIDRPARVIGGQPFDIAATTTEGDAAYQALTWSWDLDGNATDDFTVRTKALSQVTVPTQSGPHRVRVRATDTGGRVAEAELTLNVRRANEAPPVAKYTYAPSAVRSGEQVTFDASTSQLSDPDGVLLPAVGENPANVKFRWSFGDGTAEVVTTTATVRHTYAGSGRPTASLVVEDARATPSTLSDPVEKTLAVAPGTTDANAPKAVLALQDPAPGQPVFAKRPVTVSAAGSAPATGHAPITYAFDLDGDGTFEKAAAAEPTVTFQPPAAGPLSVRVKVTDAFESATVATLALTVNAEPVAPPTAVLTGPEQLTLTGVSVAGSYDATGSKGNNLDPAVSYRWDLDDDGTFETPTGTDPKLSTAFSSPGEKTIKVRVTDTYGNAATASTTTIVRSPADIAAGCTGTASFREVAFYNVRIRGCVQTVKRPSAGDLHVLSGKLLFGGLQLSQGTGPNPTARPFADCASDACKAVEGQFNTPAKGWAVVLDSADGTLRSNGPAALRAVGAGIDLPLNTGALNINLPTVPADGFTLGTPQDAKLFGFPLAGSVTVRFPAAGETAVTLNVGLPVVLGGFTGTATIRATASGGVVLDELRIAVGEVAIGKLGLGDLSFVYSRPDDLWQGGGSLTLPTPKPLTISAELAIQANRFKSIKAEVSGINQPISQAIYLQAIRAGLAVDPLDLSAGITLSAGPAVKGKALLALDGDMRLRFPSAAANYYLFQLTGRLKLADFQLATAFAQFSSNGFFEAGGGIDADFKIAYLQAGVKGWITRNAFNIDGDAEVGLKINGTKYGLAGAHVTLSTVGFGACGEIPVLDLGGGFGSKWGQGVDTFWGCDLSPYRAQRPADAPATPTFGDGARAQRSALQRGRLLVAGPQGHVIDVPAKQEKTLLTVTGATAPPRVTIVDAKGGILLSTPADGKEVLTEKMMVKTDADAKTTTVLWKAPPGGKAWVLSQSGASRVSKVSMALPAPKRTYGIKVEGSGSKRALAWKISPPLVAGETIQLAEEGGEAGTQLVTTAKSSGRVPFTPQGGRYGKRTITAVVSADGLPSTKQAVGTYVAPKPPTPARAKALTLTRSSSGVLARWTPGTGGAVKAAKWNVVVRVAHSQRKQLLTIPGNRTSVRIPNINPGDAVTAVLSASDAAGITGPSRAAIVKAGLRASSGAKAKADTAKPRDVVVRRLKSGKLRVTWKTGGAYLRGFSVRVTSGGVVTLLRTAGKDHTAEFADIEKGKLRVTVIGRRFQGTVTRKDVVYIDA